MAPSVPQHRSDESSSLFERHAPAVVDTVILAMMDLRRKGASEPSIMEDVLRDWTDQDAHLAWGIMLARIRDGKEQRIQLPLFMTVPDRRFATHRFIADWRAKRLSCDTLVEVGCGIGSQTISFSKTCSKVIAIDTDHRKIAFAKANMQKLGITNVEFIVGDAIEILPTLLSVDTIFCEPSRPPEHHTTSGQSDPTIQHDSPLHPWSPNPVELIEAAAHTASNVAIELSPATKDFPITGEWEYASINGQLARLTVYRGEIARAAKAAVVLPAGQVLTDKNPRHDRSKVPSCKTYLFEVDEAVAVAGLVDRIPIADTFVLDSSKQTLLTSNHRTSSPFFSCVFRFLATVPRKESLPDALNKVGAKKAVIRYAVDPAQYWEERRQLEARLSGTKTVHIFTCGESFVLAEKIKNYSS